MFQLWIYFNSEYVSSLDTFKLYISIVEIKFEACQLHGVEKKTFHPGVSFLNRCHLLQEGHTHLWISTRIRDIELAFFILTKIIMINGRITVLSEITPKTVLYSGFDTLVNHSSWS